MSELTTLLLLAVPLVLIMASATVVIVALIRAAPADVPAVMDTACSIFCRLVDLLPYPQRRRQLGCSASETVSDSKDPKKEVDQ